MKHEILPDGKLRIIADDDERVQLKELRDARKEAGEPFGTEQDELFALDSWFYATPYFEWLPETAPALGIKDIPYGETIVKGDKYYVGRVFDDLPSKRFGEVETGSLEDGTSLYAAIIARWTYRNDIAAQVFLKGQRIDPSPPYESFLDELIFRGHVDWEGGYAE